MNFQAIRNASGKYTPAFFTLLSAEPARQGKFGMECKCLLLDDAGEQQSVTIGTGKYNNPLPEASSQGQRLKFSVNNKGQYYNGIWDSRTKVAQPAHPSPQAPAQAQRPAPAPKNGQDEVYKYRSMCLAYVKDLLVAGAITPVDINVWLDRCMKYIMSGLWLSAHQNASDEQPLVGAGVENDDIPF